VGAFYVLNVLFVYDMITSEHKIVMKTLTIVAIHTSALFEKQTKVH